MSTRRSLQSVEKSRPRRRYAAQARVVTADAATQKAKSRRDCNAQSNHVPPLPNVLVVLPPNRLPPVVLLLEPNALPVFEPKPEAKDELDSIPRETLGASRIGAHC